VTGLSFKLPDSFVDSYAERPVDWGYPDAGGNAVGEITFLRTYSRLKEGGAKETWVDVCRRVTEGTYSIQKDHAKSSRLPWNENKAIASAKEFFERLFTFKFTPPGRGLWMMGTSYVHERKNSAALQNCAFVSTGDIDKRFPERPFTFLMEASMLGIGVGFDTLGRHKGVEIRAPHFAPEETYVITDDREGWVESVSMVLRAYLRSDALPHFDYSQIRPSGQPIKGFGGTAAGPDPLIRLHLALHDLLGAKVGQTLDSELIVDIMNLIGVCVVSGNVRRSAELALGEPDDYAFPYLKDAERFPERNAPGSGWGWMSNNSIAGYVGMDYEPYLESIALNGEPGIVWLDTSRAYGRLEDPRNDKDHRVRGYNPCAEQSLESFECCTLVETFLSRHETVQDFQRTLKFAYLYAKTVTLLSTHWPETNAVMTRNRRIGCSISGWAGFIEEHGWSSMRDWARSGYETVQRYDEIYSEWLGVRQSVKTTTVKPSGTVSLLVGETPGVHWPPGGRYHMRAIRFGKDDPMVDLFRMAKYKVEDDVMSPETTVVVYFPVRTRQIRDDKSVTIWEKVQLAALAQRFWSDNSVSVTLSFDRETEARHLGPILAMFEGQLKTVSFLPQGNEVYQQMPYTQIDESTYYSYIDGGVLPIPTSVLYEAAAGRDAIGEAYCTTDTCEIKEILT
jgi:ribonucleoside-triphosphate reductase